MNHRFLLDRPVRSRSACSGLPEPARCTPARRRTADLPAQVFAPETMAPLTKVEVFPAEIQLTTARDRQSIVVQATYADGITRDVTREATITPADAKLLQAGRGDLLPGGRRRDDACGRLWRQDGHRAGEGFAGGRAAAAQLPARRDAGVHAGGLQHRKLPRGRARQGRLSHLALRLRPRGRPFPLDPRDGRAADQPGRPVGQHAARQGDRAPSTTPAASGSSRAASSTRPCTAGSKPVRPTTMPAKLPTVVGVDLYPQRAVLDGKGSTQQLTAAGPLLRRDRPRRHQPGRLLDQ